MQQWCQRRPTHTLRRSTVWSARVLLWFERLTVRPWSFRLVFSTDIISTYCDYCLIDLWAALRLVTSQNNTHRHFNDVSLLLSNSQYALYIGAFLRSSLPRRIRFWLCLIDFAFFEDIGCWQIQSMVREYGSLQCQSWLSCTARLSNVTK